MKKRISLLLAVIMIIAMIPTSFASTYTADAIKYNEIFILDGEEIEMTSYKIWGNNYVKLRDIAEIMSGKKAQFSVEYDQTLNKTLIKTGKPYVKQEERAINNFGKKETALLSEITINVNNQDILIESALIKGNNFVKLRDIGDIVCFDVKYDESIKRVILNSDGIEDSTREEDGVEYLQVNMLVPGTVEELAKQIYDILNERDIQKIIFFRLPKNVTYNNASDYGWPIDSAFLKIRGEDCTEVNASYYFGDGYQAYSSALNGSKCFIPMKIVYGMNVDTCNNTKAENIKYKAELQKTIDSWDKNLTDLEKARLINRYIINRIDYDYDYKIYRFMEALKWNKGICSAYASIFKKMADLSNLECEVVSSKVHAFNAVKINGEWRFFDSTWNDHDEESLKEVWFNLTLEELYKLDYGKLSATGDKDCHILEDKTLEKLGIK